MERKRTVPPVSDWPTDDLGMDQREKEKGHGICSEEDCGKFFRGKGCEGDIFTPSPRCGKGTQRGILGIIVERRQG